MEPAPRHSGPVRLPIYMDHHATTPTDPRVVEAMGPFFSETFGNPASKNHVFGWRAEEAVETARAQVAALVGAQPKEIVFTSGATESDNLMLKGAAARLSERGNHIVTVVTEHPAVLDTVAVLEAHGFRVTRLPVGKDGLLAPADVERAIGSDTILVSVMWANNEIGVVQPIAALGRVCRERGVLFAVDAAQALGKLPTDVREAGVDLLAVSSHKLYGPKGVGALYVRSGAPRIRLEAQMDGGGHERGFRSGTLNVPGIVGFGVACEIAAAEMAAESKRVLGLRERLRQGILSRVEGVQVNGSLAHRLPGNLNLSFEGVDGEALLMALRDVAVSSGSACASASPEPSHVILALGVSRELAHASLRFGLGRGNTEAEVDYVIDLVEEKVKQLRAMPAAAPVRRTVQ
ncbi:MAG TPA: IscS subfamily cysteine desulfurase [Candidatus Eisenbacteria bacterium]|nr:IscS subfamily cysteine desulfurase [Candidatus Eisenbacteria bacterium]